MHSDKHLYRQVTRSPDPGCQIETSTREKNTHTKRKNQQIVEENQLHSERLCVCVREQVRKIGVRICTSAEGQVRALHLKTRV